VVAVGTLARCARYDCRTSLGTAGAALSRLAAASQPHSLAEVVIRRKRSVWYQLGLGTVALVALVTSVKLSRPVFLSTAPIAEQLVEHRYVDSTALRAPWMHSSAEVALKTPQFLLDRELFAMDLLRTGKVTQRRARSLADIAVREAYTRQIPPALVLGVMLTENDELKSSARSNVGAIGLMQVYPKHWRGALGRKFGTNIHTDSTNLKYGIFILGWVAGRAANREEDRDAAWRRALLGYNGCVRGSNTPNCRSYPDVVRREVQRSAKSTCRGETFDQCVVAPMWLARRDAERVDTIGAPIP
jgi:soluble lytic murein transglycosylase-like protein